MRSTRPPGAGQLILPSPSRPATVVPRASSGRPAAPAAQHQLALTQNEQVRPLDNYHKLSSDQMYQRGLPSLYISSKATVEQKGSLYPFLPPPAIFVLNYLKFIQL